MNVKKAYRPAEIVAAYGLGRTKLYEEFKSGRLKYYKLGRCTLVSAEALAQWQALYEKQSA